MLKKAGLTQPPGTSPPLSEMSTRLQLPCPRMPEHRVVAGGFPVLPAQGGGRGARTSPAAPGLGRTSEMPPPCVLRQLPSSAQPRLSHLLLLFLGQGAEGRLSSCSPQGWHRKNRQPWRNRGASHACMPRLAPRSGGMLLPAPSAQGPRGDRAPPAPGLLPDLLLLLKGGFEGG